MEGLFVVKAIGCRLTRDTEVLGKMDPYVLFKTGDQKAMTSVKIDAGKICEWNETFTFYVKENDVLHFAVYDEDPGTDDLVGEGSLNVVSSFIEKQKCGYVLKYADRGSAGEVDLEVQFFPQEKRKIEEVKKYQNIIREIQMKLDKYQTNKDVEIINPTDNKKEEELRLAIEKDKEDINKLEKEFQDLYASYDIELKTMNTNLAAILQENTKLKGILTTANAKLDEYKQHIPGGQLDILCIKAEVVRDVEMVGTMDPYVKFYLGKNSAQTNVAKDQGKHPVWNQNLKLQRNDEEVLKFEVIDYNDILKSTIIGYGAVSLFKEVHGHENISLATFIYYKGQKVGNLDLELHLMK